MEKMSVLKFLLVLTCLTTVSAWDGDELEVFDAVEEVNQNFYTLLGIERNADGAAIKKAFRKLSLVLHPDKNDAADAEVQFRQLVSVYDVLKDPNKRKHYDNVLDNGLPDWKQAVYYYRRVRKMGLKESALIVFIIISIGQYLVGWGSYIEKKLAVDDYLSSKHKKTQKKQKKMKNDAYSIEEFDSVLIKPSVLDTLPCQIPRFMWFLFFSGPPLLYRTYCEYMEERKLRKQQELEEQKELEEEEVEVVPKAPRKRKTFVLPELKDDPNEGLKNKSHNPKPKEAPVISGGLWTDDDILELAKLVKKYPVGTTERWEKIGEAMNRPANEVAHMAHKLNSDMLKNLQQQKTKDEEGSGDEENEETVVIEPKKVKTRGGKVGDAAEKNQGVWSQIQQKALEAALLKFPKGAANDRWEKIAKCVPGKTKEECMVRYKHLVDMLKKRKEQDDTESSENQQNPEESRVVENGVNLEIHQQSQDSVT